MDQPERNAAGLQGVEMRGLQVARLSPQLGTARDEVTWPRYPSCGGGQGRRWDAADGKTHGDVSRRCSSVTQSVKLSVLHDSPFVFDTHRLPF